MSAGNRPTLILGRLCRREIPAADDAVESGDDKAADRGVSDHNNGGTERRVQGNRDAQMRQLVPRGARADITPTPKHSGVVKTNCELG